MKKTNSVSLFFFLTLTALEVSFVQSAEPTSDVHEISEDPSTEKPTVGFYCDHCDTTFATSTKYFSHAKINKLKPEFICSACKKKFLYSHVLKGHVRTHTGERPYECLSCPKKFADSSTLRNHERIHTGEKPFPCLSCKRAFRQQGQLKSHINKCRFLKMPALLLLAASSLESSGAPTPPRKSAFSIFVPSATLPAHTTFAEKRIRATVINETATQ